jgi:two-component system, NtrC family, sensor kinase
LRFPFYSLKTGVVACLSLLIVSAMLLINVVMIKFAERDLMTAKATSGRLLIHAMGGVIGREAVKEGVPLNRVAGEIELRKKIEEVLKEGEFSRALVADGEGKGIPGLGLWQDGHEAVLAWCTDTLRTGRPSVRLSGRTWGVTWFGPEKIVVCGPVLAGDRTIGAVAVGADLYPLYRHLRKTESVVLGYICLNALILVSFGIYLLSRSVIQPIRRLLAVTERFDEWSTLMPAGEPSRNEFGQLFRSLKMMLGRLEANKEELEAHITSLKTANLELKKAQDDMIRSEKMATAGRLATGVAHEIGNPLGIILGYLELLKRGDVQGEERADFLNRIEAEVARIHQIIRELLDFSRGSGPDRGRTAVHDLIQETVHMLSPQPMMAQISIRQALRAENDVVQAGSMELKQVFLNIIINAADAMADAGSSARGSSKELTVETENADGLVRVSFTDTGTGMPAGVRERAFDPFFTTKEPGRGTGLGLSVCYTIMQGLGGAIRLQSPAGKGTTVIVDIPLAVNQD